MDEVSQNVKLESQKQNLKRFLFLGKKSGAKVQKNESPAKCGQLERRQEEGGNGEEIQREEIAGKAVQYTGGDEN